MTDKQAKSEYTSASFTKLEGLSAVRLRPGMYIGSTDSRGLNHLIWEIFDNSVDEKLAGYGDKIKLTLHKDGSIEVSDHGRGIPVDINPKTGKSAALLATSELHAGSKFGGESSGYKSAGGVGGLHGVGSSVVNALSTRFDMKIYRENKEWRLSYCRGETGTWDGEGPDAKFTKKAVDVKSYPDERPASEKKFTGTTIRFWYDKQIFLADAHFDMNLIVARAKQTAFLVPGLEIELIDNRGEEVSTQTFKYEGGVSDMLEEYAPDAEFSPAIMFSANGEFVETVPVLNSDGTMTSQDVTRPVEAAAAIRWGKGYDYTIKSYVNIVATPLGGSHVKGLERGLSKVIGDRIKEHKLLKANEESPTLDDIREGLTAIIAVKVESPQFEGQTKEILGTAAVNGVIYNMVLEQIGAWFDNRRNLNQAKLVLQKIVNASRVRLAQRQQRETARKKNALESGSLPAKLVDCALGPEASNELLICEGDSALGGLRSARDSRYQALFPIRGKILNVQKATLKQVLENAEAASIIQVLGAGSGNSFSLDTARYSRILLAADADADGSHIRALLITLFAKYMRPIIEDGRLYTIMPPLYKLKVGGRNPEDIYALNDIEKEKLLIQLEKDGRPLRAPLSRLKGLGEMQPEDLWVTSLDPERRRLRQINWGDVHESERILELAMGSDVNMRREWIMSSDVNEDNLDI